MEITKWQTGHRDRNTQSIAVKFDPTWKIQQGDHLHVKNLSASPERIGEQFVG